MPALPAGGVACPARELMRRAIRGASVTRVRVIRGTGVSPSNLNFVAGLGEVLNGSRPCLYIPGRGTGGGSLPCHLCLPSALVSAT
jgi:hypothetical protein